MLVKIGIFISTLLFTGAFGGNQTISPNDTTLSSKGVCVLVKIEQIVESVT
jgi:hypothetical protein